MRRDLPKVLHPLAGPAACWRRARKRPRSVAGGALGCPRPRWSWSSGTAAARVEEALRRYEGIPIRHAAAAARYRARGFCKRAPIACTIAGPTLVLLLRCSADPCRPRWSPAAGRGAWCRAAERAVPDPTVYGASCARRRRLRWTHGSFESATPTARATARALDRRKYPTRHPGGPHAAALKFHGWPNCATSNYIRARQLLLLARRLLELGPRAARARLLSAWPVAFRTPRRHGAFAPCNRQRRKLSHSWSGSCSKLQRRRPDAVWARRFGPTPAASHRAPGDVQPSEQSMWLFIDIGCLFEGRGPSWPTASRWAPTA